MDLTSDKEFIRYIETPRQKVKPISIDAVLEQRMKAFLRARRPRLVTLGDTRKIKELYL